MSDDVFFGRLTTELGKRGRLALASVVETRGSGPSRIGRRFLIFEDGTFWGTIGGGPFEALVVADAAVLFREEGKPRFTKWYDFFEREIEGGQAREPTNMICGGSARVMVELLSAAPSLLVLGAGVGLALARLGRGWVMTFWSAMTGKSTRRPRYRRVRVIVSTATKSPRELPPGRDRYVAVVTRCWETNLAALRPWISEGAPPAKYLGVIGSARKVRGVFARLKQEGITEATLARVHGPIGVEIGAITPEEIAVSILAEMTAIRREARLSPAESRVPSRSAEQRSAAPHENPKSGRSD
jgi:xanthine dehydrogenase accessory factor